MINLRSNTCVHSYTLSSVASSIVSSGWLSPCGRRLWVFFNCWLEERSVEYVLRGTRILAVRSQYVPGSMQAPLAGTTPDMVAVGELKIPGTSAAVQTAVPQDGVPMYLVPDALGPRDATGASEAIGELTPLERLLSEALAEFGIEEPANLPGSLCVVRYPMSGRCAEVENKYVTRMQTRVRGDSQSDCSSRSDAGGGMQGADVVEIRDALYVVRYPMDVPCAAHAKDAADAAERLMLRPMPQLTHDRECDGCFSSELGGQAGLIACTAHCMSSRKAGCGRQQSQGDDGG